jgi:hypothetical protein
MVYIMDIMTAVLDASHAVSWVTGNPRDVLSMTLFVITGNPRDVPLMTSMSFLFEHRNLLCAVTQHNNFYDYLCDNVISN